MGWGGVMILSPVGEALRGVIRRMGALVMGMLMR